MRPLAIASVLLTVLLQPVLADQSPAPSDATSVANANTVALLSEVREALHKLDNPPFAQYTILLCTLQSETAQDLREDAPAALLLTRPDGAQLRGEPVTPQHPLWTQLRKLAPQFAPPDALPSGAGIAFKQLYAV